MAEEARRRPVPRGLRDPLCEVFSGQSVLSEFARLAEAPRAETRVIMVRFLAAQYFVNRLRGDWSERLLRIECSAALNGIGTGLVFDRELRLLRRALLEAAKVAGWPEPVTAPLVGAAQAALDRGHVAGATALFRVAYEAALAGQAWSLAAAAAGRLAALAEPTEPGLRRRWRRRARSLARRARDA